MNKKIAEITITDRWNSNLIDIIEKAGYVVTLTFDGMPEKGYIIAEPVNKEDKDDS